MNRKTGAAPDLSAMSETAAPGMPGSLRAPRPAIHARAAADAQAEPDFALRYSDTVVELGYCTRPQIEEFRQEFEETRGEPETYGAFLIERGVISREQARACERSLRGGSTIGGFSILEKVGQGGMGSVFRARQISMDRIVAVKILAPKYAQDPAFKERFLNEARTSAKLSHLNIINGIDCGEDGGYAYFAMEFVEGQTVRKLLKDKRQLAPEEAFKIVRQICDALSYARIAGIVHRDIKPDNIMLTPQGVAKLCDLGLAIQAEAERKVDEEAERDNAETEVSDSESENPEEAESQPKPKQKGVALGTPHYMSPEQARGAKSIDARSDIYSLGATLYHLLTGETMFSGPSSTSIMTQHVTEVAPSICTLDPQLPRPLACIISKMTAKSPDDRYANVDELIADLDRYKAGGKPAALDFTAPSSCLMPAETGGLVAGPVRWIPHIAAAAILGLLGYFVVQYFMGRPGANEVAANGVGAHTQMTATGIPGSTRVVDEPPKPPDPAKINGTPADHAPPDSKKTVATATAAVANTDVGPSLVKPNVPPEVKVAVKSTDPLVKPAPEIQKPPVPPVVEVKPVQNPEVVVVPPKHEDQPKPVLKLTPEILYARFLQEVENRSGAGKDLPAMYTELRELSAAPDYAVAREDIDAELNDIKGARDFEIQTAKVIGQKHPELAFSPKTAEKWGSKGTILAYEESRHRFQIRAKGAEFPIAITAFSLDDFLSYAPDKAPLSVLRYHYAQGRMQDVFSLVTHLSAEEQKRWERKIELKITKEQELKAKEYFKLFAPIVESKSWNTLIEMIADFDRDFGSTSEAKAKQATLLEWQDRAATALQPPSKWTKKFKASSLSETKDGFIQVTYDFSTDEQKKDFFAPQGGLRVENGNLIVPKQEGEYASVRFFAPCDKIRSISISCKMLGGQLAPMGVAFLEAGPINVELDASNSMLKFVPEIRSPVLLHMQDSVKIGFRTPEVNWLNEVTYGFETKGGDKEWKVDGKPVLKGKLPAQLKGGWIAIWAKGGNLSINTLRLTFLPDADWDGPPAPPQPPAAPGDRRPPPPAPPPPPKKNE